MKKIIALLLTLVLCASTFVGCGCNTTNDNTTDTTKNEIESTTDDKENDTTSDSGNVGDITGEEDTSEDDTSVDDTDKKVTIDIWTFPNRNGFTEKIVATKLDENADENWSYNKTYFLDKNDNTMIFKWDGPTTLGTQAWTSGEKIIMSNSTGEYALCAFTTGEETPEDFERNKSLDKATVITCVPGDISYIENGYYNANIEDTIMKYIFAIEGPVKGQDAKGYALLYANKDTGVSYQFYYLERLSNYDDARAWKVIESLEEISVEDFDTDEIKNYVD